MSEHDIMEWIIILQKRYSLTFEQAARLVELQNQEELNDTIEQHG